MTPIEAYVLAKNIAVSAVSGVRNISIDGTKLIIETSDGNILEMDFPTPEGIKIGYYDKNSDTFYANDDLTGEIQGKNDLLYIDKNEKKLYFWEENENSNNFQTFIEDYVLPSASKNILGGVKIGKNLEIDENGVLSVTKEMNNFENLQNVPTINGEPLKGDITEKILELIESFNEEEKNDLLNIISDDED